MNESSQLPWWRDVPQLDTLHSPSVALGLRSEQAQQRLSEAGPNRFGQTPVLPGWRQVLRHFRNPLVLTLLLASGVSAATGEVTNFLIIVCIVLLSVTLDFWQELRAGQVVERLRQSVAVRATVLRDGQWQEHPVADLVPGDVVRVAAGDLVPADALVLQARDFFVNQSVLTGESYPVEKHAHMPEDMADMEDATHAVFMGSSV
ncbi:MAG: HAD-IC family P-type ATPase, partial [Limnohabitans sp.]